MALEIDPETVGSANGAGGDQKLLRGQNTQEIDLPYICLFINTGRERVLVDTGIGVDGMGPAPENSFPSFEPKGLSLTRSAR